MVYFTNITITSMVMGKTNIYLLDICFMFCLNRCFGCLCNVSEHNSATITLLYDIEMNKERQHRAIILCQPGLLLQFLNLPNLYSLNSQNIWTVCLSCHRVFKSCCFTYNITSNTSNISANYPWWFLHLMNLKTQKYHNSNHSVCALDKKWMPLQSVHLLK